MLNAYRTLDSELNSVDGNVKYISCKNNRSRSATNHLASSTTLVTEHAQKDIPVGDFVPPDVLCSWQSSAHRSVTLGCCSGFRFCSYEEKRFNLLVLVSLLGKRERGKINHKCSLTWKEDVCRDFPFHKEFRVRVLLNVNCHENSSSETDTNTCPWRTLFFSAPPFNDITVTF